LLTEKAKEMTRRKLAEARLETITEKFDQGESVSLKQIIDGITSAEDREWLFKSLSQLYPSAKVFLNKDD